VSVLIPMVGRSRGLHKDLRAHECVDSNGEEIEGLGGVT
jgi:hypothetical protein